MEKKTFKLSIVVQWLDEGINKNDIRKKLEEEYGMNPADRNSVMHHPKIKELKPNPHPSQFIIQDDTDEEVEIQKEYRPAPYQHSEEVLRAVKPEEEGIHKY